MIYLLGIVFALQLFFWAYFLRLGFRTFYQSPDEDDLGFGTAPVSVIVCFHNEEAGLRQCLEQILEQQYFGFWEVLAVDDNSTDGSASIVHELMDDYPRLQYLQPGLTRPGKKDALTYGISQSEYDFLVLTDADCVPTSSAWLIFMTEKLRKGAEVVLGVSMYARSDMSLLDHFQNYEARYVALKYCGFAERGIPYMGVGRNLAYSKSFFERAGGLEAYAHLPGGDDDLIVSHHAQADATVCVTHRAAQTFTNPEFTWKAFFRQRRRHQSAGTHYRWYHQVLLGLLGLSHGLFFLLGLLLLFTIWWRVALALYVIRFTLVFNILSKVMPGPQSGHWLTKGILTLAVAVLIMLQDAMLAPYYLFLAVVGWFPEREW
jgi:glycosyltransferase involved in cell wall biosynthesis